MYACRQGPGQDYLPSLRLEGNPKLEDFEEAAATWLRQIRHWRRKTSGKRKLELW